MACENSDFKTSQAILAAQHINCPTGKLTEGCFDEFGNFYTIPDYCLLSIEKWLCTDNDVIITKDVEAVTDNDKTGLVFS